MIVSGQFLNTNKVDNNQSLHEITQNYKSTVDALINSWKPQPMNIENIYIR